MDICAQAFRLGLDEANARSLDLPVMNIVWLPGGSVHHYDRILIDAGDEAKQSSLVTDSVQAESSASSANSASQMPDVANPTVAEAGLLAAHFPTDIFYCFKSCRFFD